MNTPLLYTRPHILLGCHPGSHRVCHQDPCEVRRVCVLKPEEVKRTQRCLENIFTHHRDVRRQQTDISSIENRHFICRLQKYWPEYSIMYVWRKIRQTWMQMIHTVHGNKYRWYVSNTCTI